MKEFLITLDIMLPLLLMLVLGAFLRRIGLMPENVTLALNKLIFKVFLPVLLFNNIRTLDTTVLPSLGYAGYIFLSVLILYAVLSLITPRLVKSVAQSTVTVQALFRTNFAILGIPLMEAIFGQAGMASVALALPVVIPTFNVLAVFALAPCSGKADLRGTVKKIITNPLIIGVALGAVCLLLGNPLPHVANKVCSDLASMVSPLSLLVLGASLRWQGLKQNRKLICWTLLFKQLIFPLVFTALAVLLGFRNMELGVIVILFGAPTAVSSFPMAQAMGGDGELAASYVALTTICSMGTLFLLIYLCKLCAFF